MTSLYAIRINKKTSWLLFWSRSSTGNTKCSAAVSRAKTAAAISAFVDSFIQSVLNRKELIDGELQATGWNHFFIPLTLSDMLPNGRFDKQIPRHRPVSRTLSIPTCCWCYSIFRILISKTALGAQRHKCLHLHFLATKCKNIGTNIWWAFDPAVN